MKKCADAASVRHVADAASNSEHVVPDEPECSTRTRRLWALVIACITVLGLVSFFDYEPAWIGLIVSVYFGRVGSSLLRVSLSRSLSVRILLTWAGVLLTFALNSSESITRIATDPLWALGVCVASWGACLIALTVVEGTELILVACWFLIRNFLSRSSS